MIEAILELARTSAYDFRATACSVDPCRHLFDDWTAYYRLKWAIARALQPRRVLEIGVRYGYAAMAFLDACPDASYLGLDIDSDVFGGVKGAIHWARNATRGRKAEFVIADSQQLEELPGARYDLVHVDGQQDQRGYLHDLELALGGGWFILVDGYFWTRDNFLAASEFLFRNRERVEFCEIIPGYSGDLLVKVKPSERAARARTSQAIRSSYTTDYYLLDCGGYESFKKTQGTELRDNRLRAVADIASLAPRGRALDLGCGRGEISIALARQGFAVTGIDYSADAIELAKRAVAAAGPLNVVLHCADVNQIPLEGRYTVVTAADLVEHLNPGELETLYNRVVSLLSPEGLFVVHTYPNAWFYQYEHARRLRIAQSIGAYLPAEPRSRYERLMHINEQSPCVLRRQLERRFPHVTLWFADHNLENPGENLNRAFRIAEMRAAGDLFAVASRAPINPPALAAELRMDEAWPLEPGEIAITEALAPQGAEPATYFPVEVTVCNRSRFDLRSWPPFPVQLCYHWINPKTGDCVVFDGERTPISPTLRRASAGRYRLYVRTPLRAAAYRLRVTLVQEQLRWFDTAPVAAFRDATVCVREPSR